MGTILYRRAVLLIDGADISANLDELSVTYGAELLDRTTFGADTRDRRGGLKTATISGKGYWDAGATLIDPVVFNRVGVDSSVFVVFADGVTEGTTTDMGFAMFGVVENLKIGGQVGTLLALEFAAAAQGIGS